MITVSVVLLLDVSGSMIGAKLSNAQTDASTFVNLMHTNDNVGVVDFSNNANIIFPTNHASNLVKITGLSTQNDAVAAIMRTRVIGMTNIRDAISKSFGMFPPSPSHPGMVLLSDGMWNVGGDPTINLETSIPIHTIGFMIGSGGATSLQNIASLTHGTYHYSADAWDLMQIYNDIAQNTSIGHLTMNNKEAIPQMNFKTYPTILSAGNPYSKFAVSWTNQSVYYTNGIPTTNQINISLRDPDGHKVTPTIVAPGKGFVVLTVNNPKAGEWTIGAWTGNTGTLKTTVAGLEINGPTMDLKFNSLDSKVNQPISFMVKIHHDGNPINDVKLDATIESPLVSFTNDDADESKALQVSLPRKISPVSTSKKESGEHHGEILTDVMGSHTLRVTAKGISPVDNMPFTRVARVSVNVGGINAK